MIPVHRDSRGNSYIDVGNIRITYVRASTREKAKNWSGQDCLRFNAYLDPKKSKSVMQGAEIPLGANPTKTILQITDAIFNLILCNMEEK